MNPFAFPFGGGPPEPAPLAAPPAPALSASRLSLVPPAADLRTVLGEGTDAMEVDQTVPAAGAEEEQEGRMELAAGGAAAVDSVLPLASKPLFAAPRPESNPPPTQSMDVNMDESTAPTTNLERQNGVAILPAPSTSSFPYADPPSRLSRSQPVSNSFSFVPPRAASATPTLTGSWRFPFPTAHQQPSRRIEAPSDDEMGGSSSEDEEVVSALWSAPTKRESEEVVTRLEGKGKGREVIKEEEPEERGTRRKRGRVSYAETADDVDDLMPDAAAASASRQSSPLSDIPSRFASPAPSRPSAPALPSAPAPPSAPLGYWLQTGYCTSTLLKTAVKCHQCVARQAAHGCSFRFLRSFPLPVDPVLRPPTFVPTLEKDESPIFPTEYNEPFGAEMAVRLRTAVGRVLLEKGTMEEELEHARKAVRIKAWLGERTTCDLCLTAIACGSWICRCCGREVCHDCAKEVGRLGEVGGRSEREKRLAICVRGRTVAEAKGHRLGDFVRLTRMDVLELERMVEEMKAWIEQFPEAPMLELDDKLLKSYYALLPHQFTDPAEPGRPYLSIPVQHLDPRSYDPRSSSPHSPAALFHALWSRGEPMLVDINDGNRVKLDWTPGYFIEQFGEMSCTIVSNIEGTPRAATVREFFETFGRRREGDGSSEKIKDWPSTTDFKSSFPALFDDFMNAIPVGSVTRRDGVLNIASHAPINSNPPDLGPKGYFSQVSNDQPGGNGSTKLHMDVADAVNVMLWSAADPGGKPGVAAWDLFRAEDSDKIRDFLHELEARRMGMTSAEELRRANDDPIHVQQTYLDVELREQLRREKGVVSWRIWQKPGQVVFIPAGCAHQVCNFADCIKIASDFASIENVERCWKLTEEFRKQTKGTTLWKEDVLQLKTQLFWAWKSCGRLVESVEMPKGC